MSTKADQVREAAKRVAKQAAAKPEPVPGLEPTPAEQAAWIQITLDLGPAMHNALEDWVIQARRKVGAKTINRSQVIRALVSKLLDDDAFADEILQTLRQNARRR
jgi:Arc/MetJ-type ribon-helix-helix transcriptional regulator